MSTKKAFGGVLFSLFLGAFMFYSFAKADGMLVAPPGVEVYETDQKAVIFFEEGVEDLFISVAFKGNAEDFGWIVPTPSEPEVTKSTDALFTTLDELTRPEYPLAPTGRGNWSDKAMLEGVTNGGVQVLQTKKIEYYDISVLKADDKDALYNWLNDHGYSFPQAGKYIVDEYIEKGWAFTAIKIDNERLDSYGIERQLASGHAVPLRMTFETDQAVFPLKISSINSMEDNAPEGEIAFVSGAEGKGMLLDANKVVATDRVISDFDANNGSVSFHLKKRKDGALGEILRVEQAKSYLGHHQGIVVTNTVNNVYKFDIWRNKGQHQLVQVDLGSDFKQNEWQKFEFGWKQDEDDAKRVDISFFIDGVERTLNARGYGFVSLRANEINENAKLTIGGKERYNDSNGEISSYKIQREQISGELDYVPPEPAYKYYTYRNSDILLDEIVLSSSQKVVFSASFDDSMDISLSEDKKDVIRVFEGSSRRVGRRAVRPESMGVLIYMFSDKKYEIPGFDLQYAGRIDKEGIENIAKIDGKTPWISPKKDKYFLTRMYKYVDISQMNEDIYPQESKNQDSFNYAGGDNNRMILLIVLLVISFGSVMIMVFKVIKSERKPKGNIKNRKTPLPIRRSIAKK